MQYQIQANDQQYLYRLLLAADEQRIVDPYEVIHSFFAIGSIAEMKKLLMAACNAALTEEYTWQQGGAGNLLYLYEQLETLIEACYIVCKDKKRKRKIIKKIRRLVKRKQLNFVVLPSALSVKEIGNPLTVIHEFFNFYTLKHWKKALYAWLEAGLSNYTVQQSVEPRPILLYHLQLQRLMEACWYISLVTNKDPV